MQNVFATDESLNRAARIVRDYKAGKPVPDVKSEDELWDAKYLYDSAFHPDTGGEPNYLIISAILSLTCRCFRFRKNDVDWKNECTSTDEHE